MDTQQFRESYYLLAEPRVPTEATELATEPRDPHGLVGCRWAEVTAAAAAAAVICVSAGVCHQLASTTGVAGVSGEDGSRSRDWPLVWLRGLPLLVLVAVEWASSGRHGMGATTAEVRAALSRCCRCL